MKTYIDKFRELSPKEQRKLIDLLKKFNECLGKISQRIKSAT